MARGESQMNIKEIFDKMEYGVKNETLVSVQKWIESNLVYLDESIKFIGKQFKFTKEPLSLGYAQLDDAPKLIYSDVENELWFNFDKFKRIVVLQSLASLVEENSSLFARLDAFQRDISLRDISESDVNYFVRYFHLAASVPIEMSNYKRNTEFTAGNIQSVTITGSIPLYEICWKIVPILINGDSVKLNVDCRAVLVMLLFMKLCQKSGIPGNVIRLESVGQFQIDSSYDGESAAIIFDRVDVGSTVEEIIDGAFGHNGLLPWSIKRVLIQEPAYEQVKSALFLRMGEMKSGTPFDPIANITVSHDSSSLRSEMDKIVAKIKADGFQVLEVHEKSKELLTATVVVGRPPYLLENKLSLPIITIESFRTVEESVKLVKNSRFCRSASVWGDSHSTINKAASLLMDETDVQTVWVNVHGQLDPAVPFLLSDDQHGVKQDLLAYILEQSLPELKIIINPETPDILTRVNGNEVSVSDIDGIVKSAMKAQKEWYNFGTVKRSSVLSAVAFKLKSSFNEHSVLRKEAGMIGEGVIESVMEFVMKISMTVQSLKFTSVNTTGGDLVVINCKPCGVIFLHVTAIRNVIEFIKLVISFVAFGNALIIATDNDSLINELQQIFKTCGACTNVISLIKINDHLTKSNDNPKANEFSQCLDALMMNCLIMKTAWSFK